MKALVAEPGVVAIAQAAVAATEKLYLEDGSDRGLVALLIVDDSDESFDILLRHLNTDRLRFEWLATRWHPKGRVAAALRKTRESIVDPGALTPAQFAGWLGLATVPRKVTLLWRASSGTAELQLTVDLELSKGFVLLFRRSPRDTTFRWSRNDTEAKGGAPALPTLGDFPQWFAKVKGGSKWVTTLERSSLRGAARNRLEQWLSGT